MGVALLDTSAVIGFLDRSDLWHEAADLAVRSVAADHVLAVSVVTIAELLTGAKLGHRDEAIVARFLSRSIARRPVLDEAMAERAATLRAQHSTLRMPDALILATADLVADVVVTGDQQWSSIAGLRCDVRPLV